MAEPAIKKNLLYKLSVLAAAISAYFFIPGVQEFIVTGITYLKLRDFDHLRQFILSHGMWAPFISIALMALQSLVPLVPGLAITLTNAWIFGWHYGALYSWFGALIGAMLDFGIARWYGRPVAERFVEARYLTIADNFFNKHGTFAVFITRLTPIVPFKVVSYSAGLTAIPLSHFIIATGLGQTPAIILYSILGQDLIHNFRPVLAITTLLILISILLYYFRDIIERRFFSNKD